MFLTGQEEIEETMQLLTEKMKGFDANLLLRNGEQDDQDKDQVQKIDYEVKKPFIICPLYANLPPQEQMKAF